MTYRNFLSIASIVAFLFALGFILMPGQLMGLYDVDLSTPAAFWLAGFLGRLCSVSGC